MLLFGIVLYAVSGWVMNPQQPGPCRRFSPHSGGLRPSCSETEGRAITTYECRETIRADVSQSRQARAIRWLCHPAGRTLWPTPIHIPR